MKGIIKHSKPINALLVLIITGGAIYFPVFHHQFQTFWDDQWVAINEYTEAGLMPANLWRILTEYYHGQYAPLNQLYYCVLHTLVDYNPYVFHSASLFIHLVNGCLVYYIVWCLLDTGMSKLGKSERYWVSFLSALLFVLHPVSVEAVAWIAASKILIYALFYLLALLCYFSYLKTRNLVYLALTLFLFILSFGGKEQAVTLPVCLLLLDLLARRDLRQWQLWMEKLPFFALTACFCLVTMRSQVAVGEGVLSDSWQYPFYQRIVFGCYSLIEYLTKAIIPIKLSYIYPFPNQIGESLPSGLWIYPLALISVFIAGWHYLKQRWVFFLVAFFVLHLAVALHIIPIARFAITADRYMYVALVAPCIAIAFLVLRLSVNSKIRNYILPIFICYVLSLGLYTHIRSKVWRDTNTLKKYHNSNTLDSLKSELK